MNYYNENDKKTAAWLRELIKAGHIAMGEVDERSICDVESKDLKNFIQCHFFAGIGGWSVALRLSGWPDDRNVWTGSCPCQPYSAAGQGKGDADPRNLWPHFFRLIRESKPDVVFGEQVEAAIRHGWLDNLQADLEREKYAVGHCVLGAHSVGAPHIRQRLYWVADARHERTRWGATPGQAQSSRPLGDVAGRSDSSLLVDALSAGRTEGRTIARSGSVASGEPVGGMADTTSCGHRNLTGSTPEIGAAVTGRVECSPRSELHRKLSSGPQGHSDSGMADATSPRRDWPLAESEGNTRNETRLLVPCEGDGVSWLGDPNQPGSQGRREHAGQHPAERPAWTASKPLVCTDGKVRQIPAELSLFPLVDGVQPARVVCLRGAGNAIHTGTASEFISAYMDISQH